MRSIARRFSVTGGLCLVLLCLAAIPGPAGSRSNGATITVTNTNDNGPGSLRQAIVDAQDGATIQFDPALIGQTIILTTGELLIDKNITINGPGPKFLTISAIFIPKFQFRIFHVNPGHTVTIAGLTISDGHLNGSIGGAGIFNDHSTLTINNCAIRSNHSVSPGGGIYNDGSGSNASLTIINSTVASNTVLPPGGTGTGPPVGGGIANNATDGNASVTVDNCVVTGNVARAYWSSQIYVGNGGGIFNDGANATLTVTNSLVSNNVAGMSSPDMPGYEGINNLPTTTIVETTAKTNRSFGPPLMRAASGSGGGIDNGNGGTLTLDNTTLSGNSATFGGGGLNGHGNITNCTITGNQTWSGEGGGIFGDPTVTNCTISDNQAVFGGGIYGNPTVTNSTISGNTSSATFGGGGIYGGGIIRHSTISGNTGDTGGGILATGPVEIENTAFKTGAAGANIAIVGGTVTSHGYNISNDDGTGVLTGPGDLINTDPMLGPLQDNGGPTMTHALLLGSPAINTGDPNFTPPPEFDQRGPGYPRVINARIDIGAFEYQGTAPTPTATATATLSPPGPATHFTIDAPPDVIQFVPFTFTVTARDQFGKVALGYAGTVHFTSTDTGKGTQLPNDSTLTHGTGTFDAILTTTDYQTITATDTANPSITGTSPQILVFKNQGSPTPTTTPTPGVTATPSPTPTLTPTPTPTPTPGPAHSMNLSTRILVRTSDQVGIGGFIITGSAPKQVALRAIGPTLSQFGVPDPLADPVLELHGPAGFQTIINDNWRDGSCACRPEGPCPPPPLPPINDLESAICATLDPGAYTAIVRGKNDTIGVGLVEIYDLGPVTSQLGNISTRAFVGTGADVVIGGFILGGGNTTHIHINGLGPSLAQFGISPVLADPTLELRDNNGALLASNDNCGESPLGIIAPEACIDISLNPGTYTAILAGHDEGTGVGLVEIYNLQ